MKGAKQGFTLIKRAVGFHNPAMRAMPNEWYDEPRTGAPHSDRGLLTERGLHITWIEDIIRGDLHAGGVTR